MISSSFSFLPGDVARSCAGRSTPLAFTPLLLAVPPGDFDKKWLDSRPCQDFSVELCRETYFRGELSLYGPMPPTLVLGAAFGCALSMERGVPTCWGDVNASLPGLYGYVDPNVHVQAFSLSAGSNFLCFVELSGGVRCFGQPGDAAALPPVNLYGKALRLATGGSHSCVTMAAGKIVCWGSSQDGQTAVPVSLPPADAIVAGDVHVCAILSFSRRVVCWGGTESLQQAVVPADLPPAIAITAGDTYTCIIVEDSGRVVCWGFSYFEVIPPPMDLEPASFVCSGRRHVCSIAAATGSVRCWGRDSVGELDVPPDLPPSAILVCGATCTCAVQSYTGAVRCWGQDNKGVLSSMPASLRVPVSGRSMLIAANVTAAPYAQTFIDWEGPMHVAGLEWSTSQVTILRDRVRTTMAASDIVLLHRYRAGLGLSVAVVIQSQPTGAAQVIPCPLITHETAYRVKCQVDNVYAVVLRAWNGTAWQERLYKREVAVVLSGAIVQPSALSAVLPPVTLSAQDVTAHISQRLNSSVTVSVTRPGDTVRLLGSGFGANALFSTPWWPPADVSASMNNSATSPVIRSCIHLSWWASPAAYHQNGTCACNGVEDWVGEGELPLSHITAWNDTFVTFVAPPVEGVREVLLCVEGHTQSRTGNSSVRAFLAYEPPLLTQLLPSSFIDSTDVDTPVSLVVQSVLGKTFNGSTVSWGACPELAMRQTQQIGDVEGRIYYDAPLSSDVAFDLLRHCTVLPLVSSSIGECYTSNITTTTWPKDVRQRAALAFAACKSMLPASELRNEASIPGTQSYVVPMPRPVPNAVLSVAFSVSMWDAGIQLQGALATSTLTFERTGPVLRSVSPNPLLLGPSASEAAGPVQINLFGPGFRTTEEVLDPRNGLLRRPSNASVWIDGVPCSNAVVVRTGGQFAYTTCDYPVLELSGGQHSIVLNIAGLNTSLTPEDGTTAALSTSCADGYFGLFGSPGHKVCEPCPVGADCFLGIGRAPVSQPGFYNLGLPPADSQEYNVAAYENMDTPVSVTGTLCPPAVERAVSGRTIACVVRCEPSAACLGHNQCADGYVSAAPEFRCSQCADGFYRSAGVCTQCPTRGLAALLLILSGLLLVSGISYLLSSNDVNLCTLNIVLEYAQVVSLLQGPSLPLPPLASYALRSISVLRANVEVTAPECFVQISLQPESKLTVVILLPLLVFVTAAVATTMIAGVKLLRHAPSQRAASRASASQYRQLWAHIPAVCRTSIKFLSAIYLPVVKSCLEAWNCTPTLPDDGYEYLSIAFEKCWVPGGLQARMIPLAVAGLVLYGFLYPLLLACFFWVKWDCIVEDQVLLAAHTGDTRRTNPRAYDLRKCFGPLYSYYRPGMHCAALLTLARRALVCICALMLNKSPILMASSMVFVVFAVLICSAVWQPLMTPTVGYAKALARFSATLRAGHAPNAAAMKARLTSVLERSSSPYLRAALAGTLPDTDMLSVASPVWAPVVDWNLLEIELQAQVVCTGLLAVMYNAAKGSVYEANASDVISGMFFCLLLAASLHTCCTVGYDAALQLCKAVQDLVRSDGDDQAMEVTSALREGELLHPYVAGKTFIASLSAAELVRFTCLRCCRTRAQARAVLLDTKPACVDALGLSNGNLASEAAAWNLNPIDARSAGKLSADPEPVVAEGDQGRQDFAKRAVRVAAIARES